jgi:hypothetical protein
MYAFDCRKVQYAFGGALPALDAFAWIELPDKFFGRNFSSVLAFAECGAIVAGAVSAWGAELTASEQGAGEYGRTAEDDASSAGSQKITSFNGVVHISFLFG